MNKCILTFLILLTLSSCKDKVSSIYPIGYTVTLDDFKKSKQFFKSSKWNLIKVTLYDKTINDNQSFDSYYLVVDGQKKVNGYIYHAPYVRCVNGDTLKCLYLYGDYRQFYMGEPYEIPKLKKNKIPSNLIVNCDLEKRRDAICIDSSFTIDTIELSDSVFLQYSNQKNITGKNMAKRCSYFKLHNLHFEFGGKHPCIFVYKDTTYTKRNIFYFKNINQKDCFVNSLWQMLD